MIAIRNKDEIEKIRKSAKVLEKAFKAIEENLDIGVKTDFLDQVVEKVIRSLGAEPAFKGYRQYPASICTSIDEEVVHGIPGQRELKSGEIVSIDIGVKMDYQIYLMRYSLLSNQRGFRWLRLLWAMGLGHSCMKSHKYRIMVRLIRDLN
jgi:methionine aminopeptidase